MKDFTNDFMHDIPRGVATRYLKQQMVPQARFQETGSLINSKVLPMTLLIQAVKSYLARWMTS